MPVNTSAFSKRHAAAAVSPRRAENLTAPAALPFQQQRFALLLAESLKVVADDSEMTEAK